jgi:hypothetical protein
LCSQRVLLLHLIGTVQLFARSVVFPCWKETLAQQFLARIACHREIQFVLSAGTRARILCTCRRVCLRVGCGTDIRRDGVGWRRRSLTRLLLDRSARKSKVVLCCRCRVRRGRVGLSLSTQARGRVHCVGGCVVGTLQESPTLLILWCRTRHFWGSDTPPPDGLPPVQLFIAQPVLSQVSSAVSVMFDFCFFPVVVLRSLSPSLLCPRRDGQW